MSLNQILDDIKGDVGNQHVSTEEVTITPPKESTFKVSASNLNKSVLDKFNTLYQTLTAKDAVYKLTKVDYKIAQEVFTMLPQIAETEKAKITSYPSTMNKDILAGVLEKVDNSMPDEILNMFREIREQIVGNADNINNVVEGVAIYGETCKQAIERFTANRPIVIVDKESRDLFTEDMFRNSWIDDTQLDYDKYANKLSTMFKGLVEDPTLATFITYRADPVEGAAISRYPEISLFGLCEKISHLKDVLSSERSFIENYLSSLDMALDQEVKAVTANSSYLVNNANAAIEALGFFKMSHDILEMDDQFFEKTKKLIEFID